MKIDLTQARLKELLHYDPETGLFTWLRSKGARRVGAEAGSLDSLGYRRVCVEYSNYLAHRLAFLYTEGAWPVQMVDHVNGTRDDNRWENLRACTHNENRQNLSGAHAGNPSGLLGAHLRKSSGRYAGVIRLNGEKHHLGYFDTAEEAHAAYRQAKAALHTHHERLLGNTDMEVHHEKII